MDNIFNVAWRCLATSVIAVSNIPSGSVNVFGPLVFNAFIPFPLGSMSAVAKIISFMGNWTNSWNNYRIDASLAQAELDCGSTHASDETVSQLILARDRYPNCCIPTTHILRDIKSYIEHEKPREEPIVAGYITIENAPIVYVPLNVHASFVIATAEEPWQRRTSAKKAMPFSRDCFVSLGKYFVILSCTFYYWIIGSRYPVIIALRVANALLFFSWVD